MARHVAYFNDPVDIAELYGMDSAGIVRYYKEGYGSPHVHCGSEEHPVQGLRPVSVGGERWYVRRSVDTRFLSSCENFIDLYVA